MIKCVHICMGLSQSVNQSSGQLLIIASHVTAVFMMVFVWAVKPWLIGPLIQHYITDNITACKQRGGGGAALCPQRQRPSPALIERMPQQRDTPPKKSCAFAPDSTVTGSSLSQRRQGRAESASWSISSVPLLWGAKQPGSGYTPPSQRPLLPLWPPVWICESAWNSGSGPLTGWKSAGNRLF